MQLLTKKAGIKYQINVFSLAIKNNILLDGLLREIYIFCVIFPYWRVLGVKVHNFRKYVLRVD